MKIWPIVHNRNVILRHRTQFIAYSPNDSKTILYGQNKDPCSTDSNTQTCIASNFPHGTYKPHSLIINATMKNKVKQLLWYNFQKCHINAGDLTYLLKFATSGKPNCIPSNTN